jgi:hypothetical protein
MEKYVCQLLDDLQLSTENVNQPFIPPEGVDLHDVPMPEEEERTAPIRDLEEWTGVRKEQLPPAEMLSDQQVSRLLAALNTMLNAYNWSFVLQIEVPERIQYETIRQHFDQPAKVKYWDPGFFQVCRTGTEHKKCSLGEYCQCAFYAELFDGFEDEDLSPEEERSRAFDIEVKHLTRKYGDAWMRYYPYHLDPEYDDEDGNPYDYGMGEEQDE